MPHGWRLEQVCGAQELTAFFPFSPESPNGTDQTVNSLGNNQAGEVASTHQEPEGSTGDFSTNQRSIFSDRTMPTKRRSSLFSTTGSQSISCLFITSPAVKLVSPRVTATGSWRMNSHTFQYRSS